MAPLSALYQHFWRHLIRPHIVNNDTYEDPIPAPMESIETPYSTIEIP